MPGACRVHAVKDEVAGARRLDQGDQPCQRALAAAELADHRQRAAALKGEADAAQRLDHAGLREQPATDRVAALQVMRLEDRARSCGLGCRPGMALRMP